MIKKHLLDIINAKRGKLTEVTVCARDIHADLNLHACYPPVCDAMREIFRKGDRIVKLPRRKLKKGYEDRPVYEGGTFSEQCGDQNHRGPNLTIKYKVITPRNA